MSKVSNLIIYKKYLDLIFYTEMITKKYPKYEKNCLVSNIKNKTYRDIELIIKAYKTFDKKEKIKFLNELDVHLKCIQIFIRVFLKNKYIKDRNYGLGIEKYLILVF